MNQHRRPKGAPADLFGEFALKSPFGSISFTPGKGGVNVQRARRGDIRTAILRLLQEQPMHGYHIIQQLTERSGGAWTPSAGSVYPALQLLADEELVAVEESGGKKIFHLTDQGRAAAAEAAEQPAPWEATPAQWPAPSEYHEAAGKLMRAMFQVGKAGTPAQAHAAAAVLDEARKRLYALLADD